MNCKICGYDCNNNITIFNFFSNQIICNECNDKIVRADFAIFKYNDQIKKLIKIFKFYGDVQIAKHIAKNIKDKLPKGYIISFPPSAKTITEQRGFVPMELVAKELNTKYVNLFCKDYDYQQSMVEAKNRSANIRLICNPPNKIVLIDDVITTGTTMKECVRLLKEKGCKVKVIVFSGNYKKSTYNVL